MRKDSWENVTFARYTEDNCNLYNNLVEVDDRTGNGREGGRVVKIHPLRRITKDRKREPSSHVLKED